MIDCTPKGSGTDYQVGPGKAYTSIGAVPFESLKAGDTVRIFWQPNAYHEKMMISGVGTAAQPIRVCGVPGPNGELPVIDGANATTRTQLVFPYSGLQSRGVITIGHKNSDPYALQPDFITLEGLEVVDGDPAYSFTDNTGATIPYVADSAGIFVQRASDVVIRGCNVHDNNNGLFIGTTGGVELTKNVLIEANYVHDNGSLTQYYEHNVYNEVSGVTYQFNLLKSPRAGSQGTLGATIKERSAGVVMRYNWIQDGAHLLDLVDTQEAQADLEPLLSFHETFVYGNVIVRVVNPADGGSLGSMMLYGGDSGIFANYRKGTLYFYENTVAVINQAATDYGVPAVFELSTMDEHLSSRDNIYWSPTSPTQLRPVVMLGARDSAINGNAAFFTDWVSTGWTPYNQIPGDVNTVNALLTGFPPVLGGVDPGFVNSALSNYALKPSSGLIGTATALDAEAIATGNTPLFQYVMTQQGIARSQLQPSSIGGLDPR